MFFHVYTCMSAFRKKMQGIVVSYYPFLSYPSIGYQYTCCYPMLNRSNTAIGTNLFRFSIYVSYCMLQAKKSVASPKSPKSEAIPVVKIAKEEQDAGKQNYVVILKCIVL